MLKFSYGNSKLGKLAKFLGIAKSHVACFDLPAGFTCPKSDICRTFANKQTGRLKRVGRILCYATKAEAMYPNVRNLRWHNFDLLKRKSTVEMVEMILKSWNDKIEVLRLHSSGDFFNLNYFNAWVEVAKQKPDVVFFAYTKVLEYATADIPENFKIQYSYGSADDNIFNGLENKPATCYVGEFDGQYSHKIVCGEKELAHEDFVAIMKNETFVIGMH